MRVYRISKCEFINDLRGSGAAQFPGRWHSKGTYILYTAATPSLALLESVVHISNIAVSSYCMLCLDLSSDQILTVTAEELPGEWFVNPAPDRLKKIGDNFIREGRFLAMKLPSAIMPEENNILVNPNHPEFENAHVVYVRAIPIDKRFLKQGP
jgi:RES domain-containing protein